MRFDQRWPPIVQPRTTPKDVYIRFGRWEGRSRNYFNGSVELGVSVCPAKLVDDVVTLEIDKCCDEWWTQLLGQGRVVFPVTGRLVGYGSDGEPLLRQIKCLPYAIDHRSIPREAKD